MKYFFIALVSAGLLFTKPNTNTTKNNNIISVDSDADTEVDYDAETESEPQPRIKINSQKLGKIITELENTKPGNIAFNTSLLIMRNFTNPDRTQSILRVIYMNDADAAVAIVAFMRTLTKIKPSSFIYQSLSTQTESLALTILQIASKAKLWREVLENGLKDDFVRYMCDELSTNPLPKPIIDLAVLIFHVLQLISESDNDSIKLICDDIIQMINQSRNIKNKRKSIKVVKEFLNLVTSAEVQILVNAIAPYTPILFKGINTKTINVALNDIRLNNKGQTQYIVTDIEEFRKIYSTEYAALYNQVS